MKRCIGVLMIVGVLAALAGCNTMARQPRLDDAVILPRELVPGDAAVLSVRVKDKHNIVDSVEGVVKDSPEIKFRLRNDGIAPDKKAGDKVWTLPVDVPLHAPAGEFELVLTGYRSDGTPVPVRTREAKSAPLSATVTVVIESP